MLTNFIYAQSKAMFEERFAEVPNDAIVFIEDTKEIWTHGTYFDCSTLDPNIIPNLQMEIDELKSKVVTPDWNAQEGEPGYIENRTHYINTKEGVEYTLSDLDYIDINEDGGKEWYYRGGMYTYGIAVEDYNGVLKYIDPTSKEEVLYDDPYGDQNILTVKSVAEENDDITIVFRAEYSGFEDFKFLLFENVDNPVIPLDPQYLPNTVVKTTPQILSDADKNQALANLGIDPVVYNLLLHPYDLLSFDEVSGELKPIPDYLLTSDRRNFKYQNPCFYTGLTNGVLTYNYDENAFAEGAGLVFTTYRDCTIGEYELAEYTSYRIVVDSNGIIEFSE